MNKIRFGALSLCLMATIAIVQVQGMLKPLTIKRAQLLHVAKRGCCGLCPKFGTQNNTCSWSSDCPYFKLVLFDIKQTNERVKESSQFIPMVSVFSRKKQCAIKALADDGQLENFPSLPEEYQ